MILTSFSCGPFILSQPKLQNWCREPRPICETKTKPSLQCPTCFDEVACAVPASELLLGAHGYARKVKKTLFSTLQVSMQKNKLFGINSRPLKIAMIFVTQNADQTGRKQCGNGHTLKSKTICVMIRKTYRKYSVGTVTRKSLLKKRNKRYLTKDSHSSMPICRASKQGLHLSLDKHTLCGTSARHNGGVRGSWRQNHSRESRSLFSP